MKNVLSLWSTIQKQVIGHARVVDMKQIMNRGIIEVIMECKYCKKEMTLLKIMRNAFVNTRVFKCECGALCNYRKCFGYEWIEPKQRRDSIDRR